MPVFSNPNNQTKCWNLTIYDNSAKPQQITDSSAVEQNCELVMAKQRLCFIKHIFVYCICLSH